MTATVAGLPVEPLDGPGLALDSAAIAELALRGPVVRQAEAQAVAARAGVRAARAPYLPSLAVSYGRNTLGSSQGFDLLPDPLRYSGQLRFTVSYPLFDQFRREQAAAQAAVAENDAAFAERDARLEARQTLVQALATRRTAQAQLATQAAAIVAAEEDLRVQRQRYALGVGTVLDVLTSQTQLTQARLALVQARFAARTAKAQLEALVGRDL